jgi:RNA polymerase sigma factor (TIGR02999 family)
MSDEGDITRVLAGIHAGGRDALDQLVPVVYEELRRLAQRQMRGERPDHTLGTTALVHEAYLKLSGLDRIRWQNRAQFLSIAAQAMRRVLINHASARHTQKRGGGREKISLDDVVLLAEGRADDLLALDAALTRLSELDERQARVVECRFFAGLSIEETADALEVAPATVKRDWAVARAWLNRELSATG